MIRLSFSELLVNHTIWIAKCSIINLCWRLSVMQSVWVSGTNSCQNFVVHPKFSADISHSQTPPYTYSSPYQHREFWILADLDSASKVGRYPYQPSTPPTRDRVFGILADLDSVSKVGRYPCAPLHPLEIRNLGFRQICTEHQKLEGTPTSFPQT